MEVRSLYRYAKISPFKAREVTREIQGLPAVEALAKLKFIPKKAAPLIAKTLKSAIANAEQNNNLRPEALVIKEAVIGEAPTLNRIMARARGSASPIRKRTSHIRIILTDEVTITRRADRVKDNKKAASKTAKKTSSKKSSKEKSETVSAPEVVAEPVAE